MEYGCEGKYSAGTGCVHRARCVLCVLYLLLEEVSIVIPCYTRGKLMTSNH